MAVFLIPLLLLNTFGAVAGGIWLASLGYWRLVGAGIGVFFLGVIIISILLIPSIALLAPFSLRVVQRSKFLSLCITMISLVYLYAVMGFWSVAMFWYFTGEVRANHLMPALLWAYGTATGPWSYMANKEAQTGASEGLLSSAFQQVGCLMLIIYCLIADYRMDLTEMAIVFAIPMCVCALIQLRQALLAMRSSIYL